jgi:hypothetical protein
VEEREPSSSCVFLFFLRSTFKKKSMMLKIRQDFDAFAFAFAFGMIFCCYVVCYTHGCHKLTKAAHCNIYL